jgi:16S rRNA (cytosine1402-N4)-methyltransferase
MNQTPNEYVHEPVLVREIVAFLVTDKNGAYVDLTAGLGGHLKALAENLSGQARLYGIDKDESALQRAKDKVKKLKQKIELINGSYDDIEHITEGFTDKEFDGALLDLGLSSLQLDDPGRGFAFSKEGPLDMRFDRSAQIPTAADLVNKLNEREILEIIRDYGEERRARHIAAAIVKERQKGMISTNSRLSEIIKSKISPPHQNKSLARVFQALRIAVNRELDTLQTALPKIISLLKKNGRIAVITYHSLEDRIVKNTFRDLAKACTCPPGLPQCICQANPILKILTKKPVIATEREINQNSRARSAKLRVAEKIA